MNRRPWLVASLFTLSAGYGCSLANAPEDPEDPNPGTGASFPGVTSAGGASTTSAGGGSTTSTTTTSSGGGSGGAAGGCGDGVIGGAEACDDGGTEAGDGCDGDCGIEGTCAEPVPVMLTQGQGMVMAATGGESQVAEMACGVGMAGAGSDRIYAVTLPQIGRLQLRLTGAFDKTLRLFDQPCQTTETFSCGSGTNDLNLTFPALEAGTYYVVVDSADAVTNPFTLEVTVSAPQSCGDIQQGGLPDGPYMVDSGGGPSEVYCAGGTTYHEFATGQYNAPKAGWELISVPQWQDAGLQQAFIWHYNKNDGLDNLDVGWTGNNCCVYTPNSQALQFGGVGLRLYEIGGASLCSNSNGWNLAKYHFGKSSPLMAAVPPLPPNYFQTNPVTQIVQCNAANNPGIFVRRTN